MTVLHAGGSVLTLDANGKTRIVMSTPYASGEAPPPPPPPPPPDPEIPEDIAAFVAAAKAAPYTYMHPAGHRDFPEEYAANRVVPRPAATIVKIADGPASNPGLWDLGRIPQGGDIVLNPFGIVTVFDLVMTGADNTRPTEAESIKVRNDGWWEWKEDADTRMFLDTFYNDMRAYKKMGSDAEPIQSNVKAHIIIQSETNLDPVEDPLLLGRGIINHGIRRACSAYKTPYLTVAEHPMAGDTGINLTAAPEGWNIGDEVLVPTGYYRREWKGTPRSSITQWHEKIVVTGFATGPNGPNTRVLFNRHPSEPAGTGLRFDHDGPNPIGHVDDTRIEIYNLTRNIVIESPSAPIHKLGHCMDMHTPMVNIRGIQHINLGRTSKLGGIDENPVFDATSPKISLGGLQPEEGWAYDQNIAGRYAVHPHRTGFVVMGTCEYSGEALCLCDRAIYEDCVVMGTDGWAYAHHSGKCDFVNNIAYDFHGAAFSAEKGDEIGTWRGCRAIGARSETNAEKEENSRQTGKGGNGYWLLSRIVRLINCLAIDCNVAFRWSLRPKVSADEPLVSYFEDTIPWDGFPPDAKTSPSDPQLQQMDDCGGWANKGGWAINKGNPKQPHSIASLIRNIKFWEHASDAFSTEYIAHYLFENVYVHGLRKSPVNGTPAKGAPRGYSNGAINMGTNSGGIIYRNVKIVNYERAIQPFFRYTTLQVSKDLDYTQIDTVHNKVIGITLVNVTKKYGWAGNRFPDSDELVPELNPGLYEEKSIASLSSALTYAQYPISWSGTGDLIPNGVITDSVGVITRVTEGLETNIRQVQLETKLRRDGYYTHAGKRVLLVDDIVTDRATTVFYPERDRWLNKRLVFKTVVTLTLSQSRWTQLGGGASFGPGAGGTMPYLGALPSQYQALVA